MTYVSCPNCYARVQVSDALGQSTVRCPKCSRTFIVSSTAASPAIVAAPTDTAESAPPYPSSSPPPFPASTGSPAPARASAAGPATTPPLSPPPDFAAPFAQEETAKRSPTPPPFGGPTREPTRTMSPADEAMLREFGSGTGLLDMTRGVFESIPDAPPSSPPREPTSQTDTLLDRQFQLVTTALTMANKLTEVYKGELARARRLSWLAWGATALILLAGVATLVYAMKQNTSAMLQQSQAANSAILQQSQAEKAATMNTLYEDEKSRTTSLNQDLQTVRTDLRQAQHDLAAAHESQTQSQSTITQLTTELRTAKDRVTQLQAQSDANLKSSTQPAPQTQPADLPAPAPNKASLTNNNGAQAYAGK